MACNVFPEVEVDVGYDGVIYMNPARARLMVTIQLHTGDKTQAILSLEGNLGSRDLVSLPENSTRAITCVVVPQLNPDSPPDKIRLKVEGERGKEGEEGAKGKCSYSIGILA